MNSTVRNLIFWIAAALVVFLFWSVSSRIQLDEQVLSFSEFVAQVEQGHVVSATLSGNEAGTIIVGRYQNGQAIRSFAPPQTEVVDLLMTNGVEVYGRDVESSSWTGHLVSWLPIVIMIAFLIFFMRSFQAGDAEKHPMVLRAKRQEERLATKSRIFFAFSPDRKELTEEDLVGILSQKPMKDAEQTLLRTALYEMVAEGTVHRSEEGKFSVSTVLAPAPASHTPDPA